MASLAAFWSGAVMALPLLLVAVALRRRARR
jgi:hypothetical protein